MVTIALPSFSEQLVASNPVRIEEDVLVDALRSGCEEKFSCLYKMYAPALMGIISRIVKSDVAAEDVLQETFVKIWHSIDQYQKSKGRLFTWMAVLARNTAIDKLRSRGEINANKNVDMEATIGQLTRVLPLAQKQIIDLIYFKGYTHCEAAEKLHIPIGTIKTRLRGAIQTLRRYFAA